MGSAQSNLKDAVLSINASVVYSIYDMMISLSVISPNSWDLAKKKHYCRIIGLLIGSNGSW